KGIFKFANRTGQSIKEKTQGREKSQYDQARISDMSGFSNAKRGVAIELGVDPYSSNETLQRELNGITWATFAGKMTFSVARLAVLPSVSKRMVTPWWQSNGITPPGPIRLPILWNVLERLI